MLAIATLSPAVHGEHAPPAPAPDAKKAIGDVVHFPQLHNVPGNKNAAFTEAVAKAQHRLATLLRRDGKLEVFQEGLYEDFTPDLYKKWAQEKTSMVGAAKAVFPKGLPENFADLSELQREFVAEMGAARTLFYLGVLPRVRRSIDPKASAEIDKLITEGAKKYRGNVLLAMKADPKLAEAVFGKREKAAVAEIERFFKDEKNHGKRVALIYGAAHDFEPYFGSASGLSFRRNGAMDRFLRENAPPSTGRLTALQEDRGPFKTFATFAGAHSDALLYYGNLRIPEGKEGVALRKRVVAEEEKLLTHVETNKISLQAWQWQHLVTPELRIRGLRSLSPASLDGTFTVSDFRGILAVDPALRREGEAWLRRNRLLE